MIIAKLKYLHSPDVIDLLNYQPEHPDDFEILVQAMIGAANSQGEESFDFLVCSPKRLRTNLKTKTYTFGLHYLFLDNYNYTLLHSAISKLCSSITGNTWQEVANKLGCFGRWEFEDYQPY